MGVIERGYMFIYGICNQDVYIVKVTDRGDGSSAEK